MTIRIVGHQDPETEELLTRCRCGTTLEFTRADLQCRGPDRPCIGEENAYTLTCPTCGKEVWLSASGLRECRIRYLEAMLVEKPT